MTTVYDVAYGAAIYVLEDAFENFYRGKIIDLLDKNDWTKLKPSDRRMYRYANDLAEEKVYALLHQSACTKLGNFLEDFLIHTYEAAVQHNLVEPNRFYKTTPGDFFLIATNHRKYVLETASSSNTKSGGDFRLAKNDQDTINRRRKAGVTPGAYPDDVSHVFVIFDKPQYRSTKKWGYQELSEMLFGVGDVFDVWHDAEINSRVAAVITNIRDHYKPRLVKKALRSLIEQGMMERPRQHKRDDRSYDLFDMTAKI